MINIVPITYDESYLKQIAEERNKALMSLRSDWCTEPLKQREWYLNLNPDKERYFYIFYCGVLIGYCGLDKISQSDSNAEMSLLIFEKFNRKGFGGKAIKKLLDFAGSNLHLHSVYIEAYETTTNWKFWKKAGFTFHGKGPHKKYWNGRYYDSKYGCIIFEGI